MKSATLSTSPSTPPKRPASWAWLLGLAITIACLWWAVRGVNWADFGAALRTVNVPLLLLVVVIATLTFPLRMIRWRVMLRGDDDTPIAWPALWHAVAIGFMANNLLPARAGEFARAYVVKRQAPVRFITALATIGVERLFDGLFMLALMAVAIAAPSFPANTLVEGVSLAHVARGHLKHRWLTAPGRFFPYLGAAYSRACEYTCDRLGAFCQPDGAITGLLALAAGKRLHGLVDVREFAAQAVSDHGFWVRRAELVSSHPLLTKRVAALLNAGIIIPPREQWGASSQAVAA